jgi:hypothetical protein
MSKSFLLLFFKKEDLPFFSPRTYSSIWQSCCGLLRRRGVLFMCRQHPGGMP